jgi:hypothetical protein
MKSALLVMSVCFALTSVAASQSRPTDSRPSRNDRLAAADSTTERMARLGAAAKRYLDLANAATDPKEAAEYMRQYEEKERAIAEFSKEREAERKNMEFLAAIRGWKAVAEDAFRRAYERAYSGRDLQRSTLSYIDSEIANAREAETKAVALQASRELQPVVEVDVAGSMNVLRERISRLEELRQEFTRRLTTAESRR